MRVVGRGATCLGESAGRPAVGGVLADEQDVPHLSWDELVASAADVAAVIERRRSEQACLTDLRVLEVVSAIGATSAGRTTIPREEILTP
jgi:hypothetical protein